MIANRKDFYVIAHNIRSLYNIGTIFRTADALGVSQLFLTGYSGYPPRSEISKVALGADQTVPWQHVQNISALLKKLKKQGVKIISLEICPQALDYRCFKPLFPLALLVGNEKRGLSSALLKKSDRIIYLPMQGQKESLNVGVSMAVAGYYLNNFRQR
jgi:23S rRNA (guanosine2251-2'-O)-methyltransferase